MCILGDLNGWIGDRTKAGITGAFGVSEENDNGRRLVEFWAEKGLCVVILSTEICISTQEWQDGVKVKNMIDILLVKREMLRYVQDVRVVGEMGRCLSDQHVALCKVRLVGAWIKRIAMVVGG